MNYVIHRVNCHSKGLTTVSTGLPVETDYLDLGYNKIATLEGGEFTGLVNLKILDLSHNELTSIQYSHHYFLFYIGLLAASECLCGETLQKRRNPYVTMPHTGRCMYTLTLI